MPKCDLVFIIGSLRIGGCEKHLVSLANFLSSQTKLHVAIFVLFETGDLAKSLHKDICLLLPGDGFTSSSKPYRIIFIFSRLFRLLRTLFALKPRIVHAFLPFSYLFGAFAFSLFRVTSWNSRFIMSRRSLNLYQSTSFVLKHEKYLHFLPDLALANSIAIARELRSEGFHPNKIGLIYNGVNPLDTSQITHTSSRPNNIVCVANLLPYKGHVDLIKAFHHVHTTSEFNDFTLLLIGRPTPGYVDTIRDLSSSLQLENKILFIHNCSDPSSFLLSSRIAILPSHQEGFSNALLEYMAARLAIIATNVGGNTEAIAHLKNGLIVPPRDYLSIAESILLLLRNPSLAEKLASQAYTDSVTKFSSQSMFSAYTSIYDSMLSS